MFDVAGLVVLEYKQWKHTCAQLVLPLQVAIGNLSSGSDYPSVQRYPLQFTRIVISHLLPETFFFPVSTSNLAWFGMWVSEQGYKPETVGSHLAAMGHKIKCFPVPSKDYLIRVLIYRNQYVNQFCLLGHWVVRLMMYRYQYADQFSLARQWVTRLLISTETSVQISSVS